jgi:hypothetical protein
VYSSPVTFNDIVKHFITRTMLEKYDKTLLNKDNRHCEEMRSIDEAISFKPFNPLYLNDFQERLPRSLCSLAMTDFHLLSICYKYPYPLFGFTKY